MLDPAPSLSHHRGPSGAAPAEPRPRKHANAPSKRSRATIQDWLAIPEEQRAELIGGRIVYHAFPGPMHGTAQGEVYAAVKAYRHALGGGGPAGGADERWWISQEVDMQIGQLGCRPDVVGWRRSKHARCPAPNEQGVCTAVPDFVCEVLSRSTARYDHGEKREAYLRAGVGHYWIVDPMNRTLTVLTRTNIGYLVEMAGGHGDMLHAPPFEKIGIIIADLFLDDEDDTAPPESDARSTAPAAPKHRSKASPPAQAPAPPAKKARPRRG